MYKTRVNGSKTKEYLLWSAMKQRCNLTKGNYADCTMSDDFRDFQKFADWCNSQIGFNLAGYQLDKDLLFPRCKLYCRDTCVFIPKDLNCFNRVNEGKYKQGVCWHGGTGRYRARIQLVITQERVCLGLYKTEEAAFNAYHSAKLEQASVWYERLKAGEFFVDDRVVERMRTWSLESTETT